MTYSFGGVSTDSGTEKFLDHFEEICEGFFQSKKVFHHDVDDGFDFKYRYCVAITDMEEIDADDHRIAVEMYLVPEFESLCDKRKDDVREASCFDYEDEPTPYDVARYGVRILFGDETVGNPDSKPYDECSKVEGILAAIANTYETADSLRGFHLDRYVNRIGTTGWDLLEDFLHGADFVQATLARHKPASDDDE